MQRTTIHLLGLFLLCGQSAMAVEGVFITNRYMANAKPDVTDSRIQDELSSGLYRSDVVADVPSKLTRICNFRSLHPMISPDGQQVAFYRQGVEVDENNQPIAEGDATWHLSVMAIDGSKLRDLVTFNTGDKGTAVGDWPIGGWIYYHKPGPDYVTGSGEVWRVNVDDPTKNEHFYTAKAVDSPAHFTFTRFSLPICGTRVAMRGTFADCGGNNAYSTWPPQGEGTEKSAMPQGGSRDRSKTEDRIIRCMIQISPTGRYLVTFREFGHQTIAVHHWKKSDNTINPEVDIAFSEIDTWSDFKLSGSGGLYYRWAVNSDKWMLLAQGNGVRLINWCDKKIVSLGGNGKKTTWGAGDFWVKTEKRDHVELIDGTWIPYDQIEATDTN